MEKVNKMTQVDTSKWKKFKVGELFEIANGKKYPSSIRQTGELPLISTTANNNGISDYIKDRNDGVYSNCITVAYSGSVGATFYHKEKVFVGETVIALLPKFKMNQYSGLFICSILSKINSKFSYTQKIKVLQYKNEAISLPVTPEGTPDFDYMENYMKEIIKPTSKRVEKLKEEKPQTKTDTTNWGEFKVGDLFEIKRSKNDIKFERCNTGSTPLISAGNENNGIVGYINKEDFEVFPANSITVNIFGKAFVQTKDFCASANVLIIRNEHLTKNIGLFIAAILSKKHSKYNYNDQINKDKLFNETISIPVTQNMTPDW